MQKADMREAVDAGLVVTESSGKKPDKQDISSSSGNYITQAVDADIGPVNDEEPFAENTMAEQNVPTQPPTRTDEQIVPRSQWLTIGKSNLLFNAQKIQKNPIFQISVDILSNTNFFQAFTASANVPAIYLQQFWNTMKYNEKTGVYSCQVDEQWFDLSADLLRKALAITPVIPAQPFELPPSGNTVIDFVNELGYPEPVEIISNIRVNYVYQPWRAILNLINQAVMGRVYSRDPDIFLTQGKSQSQSEGPKEESNSSPHSLWTVFQGNLKFVPKGETVEVFGMAIPDPLITEAIQQSSYYPKYLEMVAKNTKKTPQESASVQPATKRAPPKKPTTTTPVKQSKPAPAPTKKPSKHKLPQKVRKGKPTFQLVDEDDEAQQESVPQEEGDDPDLELAKKMSLEAHQEKEQGEEKQDSTYSIRSTDKVDLEEFDLKSALFKHMNKNKSANRNPANYHLYHALMEALIADEDAMDKEVKDRVKNHKRKHDSDDDEDDDDDEGPSAGSNQGKSAKRRRHDSGASGSAQPPTKDDEQSSKKPRESDASASKQHPALTSTGWQITDTRDAVVDSSMHRSDPESEHSEQSSDDIPMQDEGHVSDLEDTDNAHIPKVSTTTWFKPIPEGERPATPEPEWTIPPNDFPEPENNWANTYATTYQVPTENKLQRKTYDIGSFIKWFCRRTGKKKLCKADLEDVDSEHFDRDDNTGDDNEETKPDPEEIYK
ncbi:hypothetical protein Tco_1018786 [Tanacetum coccineum]|uniref:Uncharacterized protein n=1 Tax=Tanacetum coccineum TaxID=301880 RepID=A0ABQ5FV98_9ASTR